MADTAKLPRPWFPRRDSGPVGRVEHDERGNAVWVRTRSTDRAEIPDLELSISQDHPTATRGGLSKAQVSYYDFGTTEAEQPRRRPKDLRALSRWIELRRSRAENPDDAED